MAVKPPFTDVVIHKAPSGFYEGYSLPIALISKISITLLVIWALVWPLSASGTLSDLNWYLLKGFNSFYIISVGIFALFLFAVAIIPSSGKRLLGPEGEPPEFSNFSWFSMMFGAGLGVGLMVYATAEPMGLWGSNPITVAGGVEGNTEAALTSAYRYTFLHYGFHAWAIYVVTGLALAYYAYTRDMPLTIRSALTPVLGRFANGFIGHIIDVLGVLATILGVSVTIGFGVSQLVDGIYAISGMEWLMNGEETPAPSKVGLIAALCVVMTLSILSAVSGVGRGVKYLSNLNLVLSLVLLLVFVVFGSFVFAMTTYATALFDYILHFLSLSFESYGPETLEGFLATAPSAIGSLPAADQAAVFAASIDPWGSLASFSEALPESVSALESPDELAAGLYAAGADGRLFGWQSGWTTFYWAWWIAFSPFVGLFLARISKGRSVREFILGAVIAPSLVCFAWMTILGGTAIDLELSGVAQGSIIAASVTAKLFATLEVMLSGGLLSGITIMCVVLILTFLVTSADSGILVMNTIMSGGSAETGVKHRIIWGVLLTFVIGTLLIAGGGGLDALKSAMIIAALPFTVIMGLMVISLTKALYRDSLRDK
ncbi:BCCT family transporter [Granulosicoccus antarcticus]|uniref:Glycine betaine transporter BetL n=1 Tax=Granulosicoccus antarcticus IMCC3135 TaxID=1192854 RepID=A0A2Z2P090_9GAMM|nr:BCCT family transporter [Granulosicoccus antarcticus]ASJ76165.1 Glycine betaine transporter BetL [Granulosicoccus antarcticus IMCC3135]